MRNVQLSDADDFLNFQSLVKRKNPGPARDLLVAMFPVIKGRYEHYSARKLKPETVTPAKRNTAECAALKSCYTNSLKFKRSLTPNADPANPQPLSRCPYCQIGFAETWDHFLPSSKFPDFFVYQPNLVRVCSGCNETKGNRKVSNPRSTVHPYFDDLNTVSYLSCTITKRSSALIAQFSVAPDSTGHAKDPYIEEIARRHFVGYGLETKLRAEASRKITDFKSEMLLLNTFAPLSTAILHRAMASKLRPLLGAYGAANSWEVAFWKGMTTCTDLYDYVIGQ